MMAVGSWTDIISLKHELLSFWRYRNLCEGNHLLIVLIIPHYYRHMLNIQKGGNTGTM
jgi:hypothetical protein